MSIERHEDSWIEPSKLGTCVPPYRPTFPFPGEYLSRFHESFTTCRAEQGFLIDLGIPGWLRREDALKLYEMGYFARGDILELGTHRGLSTVILAQALADSGNQGRVFTTDLCPAFADEAQGHLANRGLANRVVLHQQDAVAFCQQFLGEKKRFAFAFVDHSHAYRDMLAICPLLPGLISGGGFCLFHDFNDPRNNDPSDSNYGVSRAIFDSLDRSSFSFYGIYGCTGLYRREAQRQSTMRKWVQYLIPSLVSPDARKSA
jgi:hypothetical protein